MNEDYLWDKAGEPDAETARLEELMAQLEYSGRPLQVAPPRRPRRLAWWLAAAAAVVASLVALPLLTRGQLTDWQLADGQRVRSGETIASDAANTTIHADDTGEVKIDRGSRLRLIQASEKQQRFDLKLGTIHAYIWAPPGKFVVDTPSSKTIDLGCRYTLEVKDGGMGLLSVEMGWVAFERNKVESFIPAGASCVTRPGKGPGTPFYQDAPPAFTSALAKFDTTNDPAALNTVISSARDRDEITLWHLMVRTHGAERAKIYDRFAALVKLPPEATREAVLRGDSKAIDDAWNALDLGNTDWWREWKREWRE